MEPDSQFQSTKYWNISNSNKSGCAYMHGRFLVCNSNSGAHEKLSPVQYRTQSVKVI